MYRRLPLYVIAFVAVVLVSVGSATAASTTVAWKTTFREVEFCTPGTNCGSGQVVGLGHADSVLVLSLSRRTLTFRDGSTIVMDETVTSITFSDSGHQATITFDDAIVGGSGRFAGATGEASGSAQFSIAGGIDRTVIIRMSGTITYG